MDKNIINRLEQNFISIFSEIPNKPMQDNEDKVKSDNTPVYLNTCVLMPNHTIGKE